jgi:MFS family permease
MTKANTPDDDPQSFIDKFRVMKGSPRELWLIYATKVLEILAYGLMSSTIVLWLSADMGFSDAKTGDYIAYWSAVMTLFTVLVGSLVDAIGIKKSFLLGFWLCLISRAVMTASSSVWIAIPFGLILLAVGLAFMIPVMNAALKRYATTKQQTIAFALFYVLMNVGFVLSGLLMDYLRSDAVFGELGGTTIMGIEMSTYQVLFFWATVATVPGLIMTHLFMRRGVEGTDDEGVVIRDIEVKYENENLLRGTMLSMRDAGKNTASIFASVWKEPIFYRFLTFLFLIVLVKLVFFHMHYTFPKYGLRELGPGAPIGNLWTVLNAGLIVLLTLPVAALFDRVSSFTMLLVGTTIAALPVFLMVIPPDVFTGIANGPIGYFIGHTWLGIPVERGVDPVIISVALFVIIFSIGEAIFSPRLYQYTAAIAPKGKEGSYMALSLIPYFFAKLIVGVLSGRMLHRWCPDDDVLATRYLEDKFGVDPSTLVDPVTLAPLNKEGILNVLAGKLEYIVEKTPDQIEQGKAAIAAQDYGLWNILHEAYPRDSQTLWLVIAVMATACPIGIVLLRNVIRSREGSGDEESKMVETPPVEGEDKDPLAK